MSSESPPPRPDRRNATWFISQMILKVVFGLWTGYRARGMERLAPGGGLLLVNHQSYLDPVLVGLPLRRPVSYLARDSLFRVPALGTFMRAVYVMPINREAAGTESIREGVRRMRHGFLVGIFPEGTRTPDGRLGELKPGFVALVRRAGVPVYPVGIAGAFDALPRKAKWLRPKPVRVVFGEPFTPEELKGGTEAITAAAHERIAACVAEAEAWLGRPEIGRGGGSVDEEVTAALPLPTLESPDPPLSRSPASDSLSEATSKE
ncbi:MAG: 1-acyl-sn-glycerol-3-phosphate acyltransferase [Planctomycetota bacterium]|nr:1-acyl-sn-glycerol-3-phosphate acyltransferase [Planctomycetota bacterium]